MSYVRKKRGFLCPFFRKKYEQAPQKKNNWNADWLTARSSDSQGLSKQIRETTDCRKPRNDVVSATGVYN
jgi:hypothetical protein